MSASHAALIAQVAEYRKVLRDLVDAMEPLRVSADIALLVVASKAARAARDLLASDPVPETQEK